MSYERSYTCRNCIYRERWECGNRIIQYCAKRPNRRTFNGLTKIKVTDVACHYFREIKSK